MCVCSLFRAKDSDRLADRFWRAFVAGITAGIRCAPETCAKASCEVATAAAVVPTVRPGATNGRFLREQGVPVIGFTPVRHTPMLMHAHDEYVPAAEFLAAIRVYERLLPALANLS